MSTQQMCIDLKLKIVPTNAFAPVYILFTKNYSSAVLEKICKKKNKTHTKKNPHSARKICIILLHTCNHAALVLSDVKRQRHCLEMNSTTTRENIMWQKMLNS